MGLGLNLKVNRLPARTWNWLDMNEASLKQIEAGDEHTVITEGIAKEVTGTEAWQKEFSAIATGMGADMDRLAREANVSPIRIQSAAQSAAQSESQYGSQYGSGSGAFQDNRRAALHFVFGDGKKSFQPVEILVREGEMLTVVMDFTSAPEAGGLAAVQTRFRVQANARLRLIQMQLLGSGYTMLNDIGGSCDTGASAEVIQMFLGGDKTYAGCRTDLSGRESSLNVDVGYLGRDGQHFDMNYVADHWGEKSKSRTRAKGVLSDRAFKLFRGTIDFKAGSVGAEGEETEDVLLMGEDAVNQTIPLILCGEEDVQGSHGATIGRLDDELLFYLCSRGMSRQAANKMITRARLDAVCRRMEDGPATQMVQDYLEEVIGNES